jgi:hypothetical protein
MADDAGANANLNANLNVNVNPSTAPYAICFYLFQFLLQFLILAFEIDMIYLSVLDVICSSILLVCMIMLIPTIIIILYYWFFGLNLMVKCLYFQHASPPRECSLAPHQYSRPTWFLLFRTTCQAAIVPGELQFLMFPKECCPAIDVFDVPWRGGTLHLRQCVIVGMHFKYPSLGICLRLWL